MISPRSAEAAAALDTLPRTAFDEPRYGLARGLVLSDVGRAAESTEWLDHAGRGPLLPEEKALVAAARERNRVTRP